MKTGIELISEERHEQIKKHGRTINTDIAENADGQLATAAEILIAHEEGSEPKKYPVGWDNGITRKMLSKTYKDRLIIAGALIAAEIDRIQHQ